MPIICNTLAECKKKKELLSLATARLWVTHSPRCWVIPSRRTKCCGIQGIHDKEYARLEDEFNAPLGKPFGDETRAAPILSWAENTIFLFFSQS